MSYYHRFYTTQYKIFRFVPTFYVSSKELKSWIDNPPEWAKKQIEDDFSSFPVITKESLDQAYEENFTPHNQLLKVQIKNGKVYTPEEINRKLPHYKGILPVIKYLATRGYLSDCVFILCTQDYLISKSKNPVPILTYAKNLDVPIEKDAILIPDWLNLKSWEFFSRTLAHAKRKYSFDKRIKKLFWRGGCADSMGHRQNLIDLDGISDVMDAKFVGKGYSAKHVPIYAHLAYLYQINLDGARCSWSRFVWQLSSESVVFKGKSNQMQWFYRGLKPDTHYLEIPLEITEIEKTIGELNNNPEEVQKLIKNASEFSQNNLKVSHMYAYIALVLRSYAKRYNGNHALQDRMIPYQ